MRQTRGISIKNFRKCGSEQHGGIFGINFLKLQKVCSFLSTFIFAVPEFSNIEYYSTPLPNGPNNPFKCPDIPKSGRKNSGAQVCSTSTLKRPNTTEDQSNFSPIKKSKNHAGPFNPDTKKILRYHFYEYNKENDPEELKKPSNFVYRTIEAELEYKGLPSLEYLQIAGQFKKMIKVLLFYRVIGYHLFDVTYM